MRIRFTEHFFRLSFPLGRRARAKYPRRYWHALPLPGIVSYSPSNLPISCAYCDECFSYCRGKDVIWNWLLYYNLWGISNERQERRLTVQSRTGSFADFTVSSHKGSRTLTLVFANVMETRSSIHARARCTRVWFSCTQMHGLDSTLVLSKLLCTASMCFMHRP